MSNLGFPADGVDDQGWKLYIASLVAIIVAGLTVVARIATRISTHNLGWDDAAIVLSLVRRAPVLLSSANLQCFSVVVSVFMQLAVQNGYGMHKADLTSDQIHIVLRDFFIAQSPYKATVCLNKVSTVLLYLRIFISRGFRIAAFTVLGIVVAWSIGGICATIWQCVPIRGAWDIKAHARCIDSGKFWIAYAVMNVLTDVMVLALPIPSILKLQLSRREKVLLCCLFLLGGL